MLKRTICLLAVFGALEAQQVVAPTPEPVGSARGDDRGPYNITQSFETGYRWSRIGGDLGQYRSAVNYRNGLRLLGSSLSVNSKDGHGRYFDQILLNTNGLGNDPFQSAVLRIRKNRLYSYDLTWRYSEYFNPGLTVAGGTHLADTGRRLQDHDVTILPDSWFQVHLGYSRNTETGPALSTALEFDSNGSSLPVFTNVRREWNEYRLGADVDYRGFKLTVLRRWDFFKDDSPFGPSVAVGTAPGLLPVIELFRRSQPVHGSSPGWLGNLLTQRKLWAMNARVTYLSATNDFVLDEVASGVGQSGGASSRQILVTGRARRPAVTGDLSLSLFPTERITVVNNTSVRSNRILGDSSYSEVNSGFNFGTTINFRYLGMRTVTNATDVNYRLRDWLGFYAGYRYSDRLVRTVEGFALPSAPDAAESDAYDVTNTLHTGTAGVRVRPFKPLTVSLEGELGRANQPLTPVSERNYHSINGRVDYRTRKLQLATAYRQVYNLNAPASFSLFSSHSRSYSANGSWSLRNGLSIDASYARLHVDTVSFLQFFAGQGRPQLQTGYSSLYFSNIHSGSLGMHVTPRRFLSIYAGYSIARDTGDGRAAAVPQGVADPIQALLSSVQTFPLNYQSPLGRVSIRITPKLRWNAGWQFYRYREDFHILGYDRNFRAHTGYTSILWSF